MRKGTSLFLDANESLADSNIYKDVLMSDIVISGNEVVKNRFSNPGTIFSTIPDNKEPGPLSKHFIQQWEHAKSIASSYENLIHNRISEVLDIIHEAFELALVAGADYHWYFANANEGEMGDMDIPSDDESEISYIYNRTNHRSLDIISNENYDYKYGFPKKFLFMKNEDILSYIKEETHIGKEKKAEKKRKQKERSKENNKKKEELLKKLSPEEKKLLGIK